jgi:hypothetical protein
VQQAVVQGAVEQVDGRLDVGVGADLPARDRAPEQGPGLCAARLDVPLPVQVAERRVRRRLGHQRANDPAERPSAGPLDPPGKQREQVAAQRAAVRRIRARLGQLLVQDVEGERLLGGPPAIDGRLAHPGLLRDRVHADRAEAVAQHQFRRRGEDGPPGGLTARPPPGWRGHPASSATSASVSRRFAAGSSGSTCAGFLKPTMAPSTAGLRSVQAMATAPGLVP